LRWLAPSAQMKEKMKMNFKIKPSITDAEPR
jgi:hypothetical protein